MSHRRTRLNPIAEATQFISSGRDKPCLNARWINGYKGMKNTNLFRYCVNACRAANYILCFWLHICDILLPMGTIFVNCFNLKKTKQKKLNTFNEEENNFVVHKAIN